MTAKSAAAGILTGAITILLWESFAPTIASSGTGWIANIASLYSMIPGFLLSSATVWLTGKTGAPPTEEVILQHERMVQACESPK
jgi:SSS family solute:Na+ symporter